MFGLTFGSLLLNESRNNYSYQQLHKNVVKKRYFNNTNVDSKWFEDYLIKKSSPDELKSWIRNTFSYNQPTSESYYIPIELDKIPRNKMLKWTSYYTYYKSLWQLSREELEHASELLILIEDKIGIEFPDIIDNNIYFLKFGGNRVECGYRPKFLTSCLGLIKDVCYFTLNMLGFGKGKLSEYGFTYFYYVDDKNKLRKNLLFIHGFGFGISQYMSYLLELRKKFNIYVIVSPNISNMEYGNYNNYKHDPKTITPDYNVWRDDIKSLMIKHNINKINCIAHSFGTIVFGILFNDQWINERIDKKVLIEPVCFFEKSYKVFRYINEQHNNNNGIINPLFNELIYKDIYLRYTTQRFLYGPEFWILDYSKLSGHTLVILSEKDQIVPTDILYERLSENKIECIYVKDAYHSDMFMSNKYNDVFVKVDDFIYG